MSLVPFPEVFLQLLPSHSTFSLRNVNTLALWDLSAQRRYFSITITFVSQRNNVNIQAIVSCESEEKPRLRCAGATWLLERYY